MIREEGRQVVEMERGVREKALEREKEEWVKERERVVGDGERVVGEGVGDGEISKSGQDGPEISRKI